MHGKRYFNADDGSSAYFVCATDLEHAKAILAGEGVELLDPSGTPKPPHHPDVSHPTMWMEIDEQRASKLTVFGRSRPLTSLRVGQWVAVDNASASSRTSAGS